MRGRVLVVFPENVLGGAELAVIRIVPLLRDMGWDMRAWIPGEGRLRDAWTATGAPSDGFERPVRYSLAGLREPPGALRRVLALPGYGRRFRCGLDRARPDLVHVNGVFAAPEALLARRRRIPVLFHAHDIWSSAKGRLMTGVALRNSRVCVACSRATAAALPPTGLRCAVHVVHAGLPPVAVSADPSSPPVIGLLGAVLPRKGTDTFLEAAALIRARIPDARFEVLGRDAPFTEPEFASRVRSLASALGDAVSIRESRDVIGDIARWSALVLPSREEPYGLAALEGMSIGLPVVATRVGGIPEIVEDGVSGLLVPPDSPTAIADRVVRLLEDDTARTAISQAARSRAREFTLARQAEAMAEVYRVAVGGAPAGSR